MLQKEKKRALKANISDVPPQNTWEKLATMSNLKEGIVPF